MHPDATTPQDLEPEPRVEGPVKIFWHSIPPGLLSFPTSITSMILSLEHWSYEFVSISPHCLAQILTMDQWNQPLHIYACAAKQGWNPPKIPLGALIQLLDLISVRFFKSSILRNSLCPFPFLALPYHHCSPQAACPPLCLLSANFILSTQLENCCHQERITSASSTASITISLLNSISFVITFPLISKNLIFISVFSITSPISSRNLLY